MIECLRCLLLYLRSSDKDRQAAWHIARHYVFATEHILMVIGLPTGGMARSPSASSSRITTDFLFYLLRLAQTPRALGYFWNSG